MREGLKRVDIICNYEGGGSGKWDCEGKLGGIR